MASIKIPIGTDNTGLNTGASAAEKRLDKFKGHATRAFAAIAAAGGLLTFFRNIAEQMDRIGKVSRGGIDVEFAQKLLRASELAGTSFESSLKAIRMFVKEIRSVDGPTAEVAAVIDALGLNLAELQQLDAQTLFTTISTTVGQLDDETDQLAATTGLLGTRYGDLLPLIQEIAHNGLPEMVTASEDTIANIEQFNDSITTLKQTLMVVFAPVLAFIAKSLQSLVRALNIAGENIGSIINLVIAVGGKVRTALDGIFSFDRDKIRKGLDGWRQEFGAFIEDVKENLDQGFEEIGDIWKKKSKQANTGEGRLTGKTLNLQKSGSQIIEESRAAYEAEQARRRKIGEERRKAREEAARERESARQGKVKDLQDEGRGIMAGITGRLAALNAPQNITVSSMRSIGGGGGVALPNEQKVLRVNEEQLKRLGDIYQQLKSLNMAGGDRTFK